MESRDALRRVGLNDKEIAAYLALLETSEATVLTIARKAGVKRPTCYLVLNALVEKGFASRITKKRQTLFSPQHPKKILAEAELHVAQIKNVLPQLEAMLQNKDERPRLMVYEGVTALDLAYDDAFLVKGEILFMSNTAIIQEIFARTINKFGYISRSSEYRLREILDDSAQSISYASHESGPNRQIRLMPKEFSPFATDIGIFGNTTLITSAKKEFFTVKIESEEIAHAFRAMFEAMWQISKPAIENATS